MSQWLTHHASEHYGLFIPPDFIHLALIAMKHLQDAGRLNVIYDLVKRFGTKRPDGSDSYFPTKRMPTGLLQYKAQFFVAKPGQHVSVFSCLIKVLYMYTSLYTLFVLMIIEGGCNQCMSSLIPTGQNSSVDHFGVLNPLNRDLVLLSGSINSMCMYMIYRIAVIFCERNFHQNLALV